MKVLWSSNAPWAGTGYGVQSSLVCRRLRDAGHDVAVLAFYGLHGNVLGWEGLKVYPGGYHAYGNDVLLQHAHHHFGGKLEDGLIVTLIDVWVLDAPALSRANFAPWTPVDHEPAPPRVVETLQTSGGTPLAMSRFGERMLTQAGLNPLYVPHCVDTSEYQPRDRGECRRMMGLPESAFLVGMVAANKGYPSRKGFSQALEAFTVFQRTHDDAILYLHTEPYGQCQGVNLVDLIRLSGVPETAVRFPDPYQYSLSFPAEYMAGAYSAMDVLLNPSWGEGFGIPIVEAAACGTPAITTDWTAMTEVGAVGWYVGGDRYFTDQNAYMKIPRVDDIVRALKDAHSRAARLRGEAREHALAYDADLVFETYWQPALAQLEQTVGERDVEAVAA